MPRPVPVLPRVDFEDVLARWRGRGASLKRGVRLAEAFGVSQASVCVHVSTSGRRYVVLVRVKASWTARKRYACVLFLRDLPFAAGVLEASWASELCSHAVAALWSLFRSEPGPSHRTGEPRELWQSALQYYAPWPRCCALEMYEPPAADDTKIGRGVASFMQTRKRLRAEERATVPDWRVTAAIFRRLGVAPSYMVHPLHFLPRPLALQEATTVIQNILVGTVRRTKKLGQRKEPKQKAVCARKRRRRG